MTLRSTLVGPPNKNKRTKSGHLIPMTYAYLNLRLGKAKYTTIRLLFDSGASGTLLSHKFAKKLRVRQSKSTSWKTAAGTFSTTGKAKVNFRLPELHRTRSIEWNVNVTEQDMNYDMIVGRDLLTELGVIIDFDRNVTKWDDAEVPMKDYDSIPDTDFHIQD